MKFKFNISSRLVTGILLLVSSLTQLVIANDDWLLVSPAFTKEVVLLDKNGKEHHVWKSAFKHAGGSRLLPDGAILSVLDMPKEDTFNGGGIYGGGLEILEWNGDVRWQFWSAVTHQMNVADAIMLPNGNVLAAILEWKSKEETEKAGREPATIDSKGFFVPALIEYRPKGKTAGVPVWKWSLWDHLYQQKHPALSNYSFPNAKSGCVDINVFSNAKGRKWLYPIAISYLESEDLVAITVNGIQDVLIIDHSTSTNEAATEMGGNQKNGGRILNKPKVVTAEPSNSLSGTAILNAEWLSQRDENSKAKFMALGYKDDLFSYSELVLSQDWSLKMKPASFQWKKGDSAEIRTKLDFTPTSAVLAFDNHWVLSSNVTGEVALVDNSGLLKWKYQNKYGEHKVKFISGSITNVCCGGKSEQEANQAVEVRMVAPLSSVRYYNDKYSIK